QPRFFENGGGPVPGNACRGESAAGSSVLGGSACLATQRATRSRIAGASSSSHESGRRVSPSPSTGEGRGGGGAKAGGGGAKAGAGGATTCGGGGTTPASSLSLSAPGGGEAR